MRTLHQLASPNSQGGGADFVVTGHSIQGAAGLLIVYSMVGTYTTTHNNTIQCARRSRHYSRSTVGCAAFAQLPSLSFIVSVFGSWSITRPSRGGRTRDRPSDSSVVDVNRHYRVESCSRGAIMDSCIAATKDSPGGSLGHGRCQKSKNNVRLLGV